MCGIAGILDPHSKLGPQALDTQVHSMSDALTHRGPDAKGHWRDDTGRVALGFRRLSILDLSENGHQPMVSACGRYAIVFNGEIYNYESLKEEVLQSGRFQGPFRGHSDTEVLLAALTVWGVEASLPKANGMFALAVWDRHEGVLWLARDRIGEKPLYYGWVNGCFVFASELKAILTIKGGPLSVDEGAIELFFRHNCIPAPYSIYREIRKLPAGSFARVIQKNAEAGALAFPVVSPYWSAKGVVEAGAGNRFSGSFEDAVDALEDRLKLAIRIRMQADVPLGAFLSGGIDSATLVALMQAQSTARVKTFTIGFEESGWDEAKDAKAIARHLGTDHAESYVSATQAQEVIPLLAGMYDEPFADSSQIPTYLVSKLARQHVTVSLSGDGGDELFGGYNRYVWGRAYWERLGGWPAPIRGAMAGALKCLTPRSWERVLRSIAPLLPRSFRWAAPGEKIQKLAEVLSVRSSHELYVKLTSHFDSADPSRQLVLRGAEPVTLPLTLIDSPQHQPALSDLTERMMYWDLVTYLADDILTKVDRASMAVSLESRAPYLDPSLLEFAWRLPLTWRVRGSRTKVILREVLYRHVPRRLMERPKMGFSVPVGEWIRGPLRGWAESLLSERLLKDQGFLNPALVRAMLGEHLAGDRNWQHHLWDILMFQAWVEKSGSVGKRGA